MTNHDQASDFDDGCASGRIEMKNLYDSLIIDTYTYIYIALTVVNNGVWIVLLFYIRLA
jgi:hypothetical protein